MRGRAGWIGVATACVALGTVVVPARADLLRPNPIGNPSFELQAGADPSTTIGGGATSLTPLWYTDPGATTTVADVDGNGDNEAVIAADGPEAPTRDLFQVAAPPLQISTLDFDALGFAVEAGRLAHQATVRLGFSLTPVYQVHPFVAVFNEGSLVLPVGAAGVGPDGHVSIDPAAGRIECPVDGNGHVWMTCTNFRSDFNAAKNDPAARHRLLGRARIVEVDFTGFGALAPGESIVLDDIVISGDRTAAEGATAFPGAPISH